VAGHLRGAAIHAAASAAAPAEQRDAIGLDFRRITLVPVLVVPLARLQTALHVDLFALRQVLLQAFSLLPPEHHAVPFRFLLALLVAVIPHLGRREVERGHGAPAGGVAELRVAPEIADQNDLVHTAHQLSFRSLRYPRLNGARCPISR
jgi:hypothetical protein